MNDEELHNKLEKYVRGQLPSDEAAALERDMTADLNLREQVRRHRLEVEYSEHLLREKLRNNIRQWIAEVPPVPDPPAVPFWKKRPFLTLLLVALAAAGFWFFGNKSTQRPEPQEQHQNPPVSTPDRPVAGGGEKQPTKQPLPAKPDRRYLALADNRHRLPKNLDAGDNRGDDPADPSAGDPLSAGIQAYQNGQYRAAIRELEKIKPAPDADQYALANEWLAHAWFKRGTETNDLSQAITRFQALTLQKDNAPDAQDRAEWYLLLSLVPDYPNHQARVDELLRNITAQEHHSYREGALQLRESIEKIK